MKDFTIYLKERLNEYSFLIGGRVHECDIIVDALTRKDGITITDYVLLESCLEQYSLLQYFVPQLDTELSTHIAAMQKRCREAMDGHTVLDASVREAMKAVTEADESGVLCGADEFPLLAHVFAGAENGAVFSADSLLAAVGKSLGRYEDGFVPDADLFKVSEQAFLDALGEIAPDADMERLTARAFAQLESGAVVDGESLLLLYLLSAGGTNALSFDASIRDTTLSNGLGKQEIKTIFGQELAFAAESIFKAFRAECGIYLSTAVSELARKFVGQATVEFTSEASATTAAKRSRHLSEVDDGALAAIDDMTLGELDYVLLAD